MTRKDYELIAQVIRVAKYNEAFSAGAAALAIADIESMFVISLKAQNRAFNEATFRLACTPRATEVK